MRILLVDDEEKFGRILAMSLEKEGHLVETFSDPYSALERANNQAFDLVLSDIRMPKMDGLELVEVMQKQQAEADFVLMTAYATLDDAITAIRSGVADFLLKPFKTEQLLHVIKRLAEARRLRAENQLLRDELDKRVGSVELVGQASAFTAVVEMAKKVASSEATILIRGPSGTGKELLARLIHGHSSRRHHPMVTINCGAIPETLLESELFGYEKGAFTGALARKRGKVELAAGGTLFLDEIGELAPALQVKLLRFLQEKTFNRVGGVKALTADVRILAATNRDLEGAIGQGEFREDLYYRLNVVSLVLPPLRERREDIEGLASFFLDRHSGGRLRLGPAALQSMQRYEWPGNVRELENVMERASVVCDGDVVEASDLPFVNASVPMTSSGPGAGLYDIDIPPSGFSLAALERAVVERALLLENGVKTKTAARLGITRRQLDSKLRRYELD